MGHFFWDALYCVFDILCNSLLFDCGCAPRKPDPSERRMSRRASERRLGAKVKIAVEEPIKERSVDDIISSLKAAREGK